MNIQALLNFPTLETERLILQPLTDEHFSDVMEIMSDKEVRNGILLPARDTREKQLKWWNDFKKKRKAGEVVQWSAFKKEDNSFVALFTVKEIDHSCHRGEVGYSVIRSRWGEGYASEGVQRVVDYMFHTVAIHSLIAQILPNNLASQKIVTRIGFQQEATLHHAHFYEGEYYDLLQFYLINPSHQ